MTKYSFAHSSRKILQKLARNQIVPSFFNSVYIWVFEGFWLFEKVLLAISTFWTYIEEWNGQKDLSQTTKSLQMPKYTLNLKMKENFEFVLIFLLLSGFMSKTKFLSFLAIFLPIFACNCPNKGTIEKLWKFLNFCLFWARFDKLLAKINFLQHFTNLVSKQTHNV